MLDGGAGNDDLQGGLGQERLIGGEGNDTIDGGDHTDTAVYSGNWSDYTISESSGTHTIVDNRAGSPDGTDTVTNVENFEFADGTVAVADLLDVGPSDIDVSSNSIDENSSAGTVVATLSTTDNALDSHSYAITNDPSGFFEISGDQILVKAGADIDFEDATSHDVTIEVTDANGNTYSETMTINVTDVDEFDVSAVTDTDTPANSVDENAAIGTTVGIVASASDADGTNSDVAYSLSDNAGGLFTIDATTGEVTTTAALDAETASSYDIEVTATSDDGSTSSTTFTVDVNNLMDEGPTDISFTNHTEDFEGGATGWSNNTTTDGGNSFSEFLGRFGNEGGLQATEKTFSTPEDANKTVIELDVYEIDSWDGESIIIEVAGETISIPLSHNVANESEQGSSGSVSWSLTSDDTNS